MIIDAHTHIFPPEIAAQRDAYVATEPVFAELYANPKAKLATAADLLASMDAAGIDISVALGFTWSDAGTVRLHNDYLLEAAAASSGRILPFCTLPLAAGQDAIETEAHRCAEAGVTGFGELRPDDLGFDLKGEAGGRLARLAEKLGSVLLFHVSEPAGHDYSGKHGLELANFYAFVCTHQGLRIIGAHWAGGLPFYALMPEVRTVLRNIAVDTAATSLLYEPSIYSHVSGLMGPEAIMFGSDFPLLSQSRSRAQIEAAVDPESAALILGGNARRFLRVS